MAKSFAVPYKASVAPIRIAPKTVSVRAAVVAPKMGVAVRVPVKPTNVSRPASIIRGAGVSVARQATTARASVSSRPMAKKGVIAPKRSGTLGGKIVGAAASSIPFIGPVVQTLIESGMAPAQAMRMAGGRRAKKGLTYNEIRGAVKVLKLVKRFAPAGHRTTLRAKAHRHRIASY